MKKGLFTLAITMIATLTFAQDHGTGLIFNEKAYEKVDMISKPLGFGDNLPERVSLKKYVPIIRSQGDMGTCVGWSSTYYLASMEYAINMDITNLYEVSSNVFDPYYTYLSIVDESSYFDCQEGSYVWEACSHLMNNGVKRFAYNTYECGAEITDRVKENQSLLNFTDYYRVYDEDDSFEENITAVQSALADNHPVVIGMGLPNSFRSIGSDGLLRTEEGEGTIGGHAMTIIGYDDNKFGGCFTLVNSWGADWGDNGYLYVKYEDYNKYNWSAFYLETELRDLKEGEGCVFGDCEDGYGRFVHSNSDVYEGDFNESTRAGYGVYFWDDYSYFGGEWEEGDRHGKGLYTDENLSKLKTYWKDGAFNGEEFVKNNINSSDDDNDEVITNNLFDYNNPFDLNAMLKKADYLTKLEGLEIEECVYGDCEDGLGMYLKSDKYVYMGYFEDGERTGYGEMYWLNDSKGHIYMGEQVNSSRSGNGTYFFPSGNKYFGEWYDGSRHGIGALFYSDGTISSGEWENGSFEGDGLGFGGTSDVILGDPKEEKPEVKDKKTIAK